MADELKRRVLAITSFFITNIKDYIDMSSSSDESDISNDEEEDEMVFYSIIMVQETRGNRLPSEILNDYVERVVSGYSRKIFKENFRMFPETYEAILRLIGPTLNATNTTGRKQIHASKQLLLTLWFLSTPDSYRSIHVKFGVGKATAFRAVRRVTYVLHCLASRFIHWPTSEEEVNETIEEFSRKRGFPNVIGALDGSYIQIRAPQVDPVSYICRKKYHAVHLLAVCNAKCLFTYCHAGDVGSVHDSRVLKNSTLGHHIEDNTYFPNDSHMIADAAYKIHPHIMVPFRDNGHLTARQQNFNFCLSSTRMAIERTFGLLKVRFRILLDCLPLTDSKRIPQVIIACCVLHNICMLQNDEFPILICRNEQNEVLNEIQGAIELGKVKRNLITHQLRMQFDRNM